MKVFARIFDAKLDLNRWVERVRLGFPKVLADFERNSIGSLLTLVYQGLGSTVLVRSSGTNLRPIFPVCKFQGHLDATS